MTKQTLRRILRTFRNMPPSRFHANNQKIRKSLADTSKIPESIWAGNPALIASYYAASDKHDAVYHEAVYGSRLVIAGREVLQAQITDYLDEIASLLEAAAVRNPDILLASGFDLGKERRVRTRVKAPSVDLNASTEHEGGSTGN